MKMKKTLTLLSIALLLATCTKQGPIGKTGESGPQGITGNNGTNGINGTIVTVKTYYNIIIPYGYVDTLYIPQITQSVVDTGTVFIQTSQLSNGKIFELQDTPFTLRNGFVVIDSQSPMLLNYDTIAVIKVTIIP